MSNLAWDYGAASLASGSDFYQLAEFADHNCARRHLQTVLGMRVDGIAIENVRHIAGRSLQVIYRVADERIITVRFMRPGESGSAFGPVQAAASQSDLVHHLAAWDAIAWIFPEDPGLPGIPKLIEQSATILATDSRTMIWRVLSYLPGERCAMRCRPAAGDCAIVAKLQCGPGAEVSHRLIQRLWNTPGRRFRIPEPIAADEALGARWERFVAGQRLEAKLSETASPAPLLSAVARDLVELHAVALGDLPAQGPPQILRRIEKVLRRIRVVLPNLLAPAEALARDLAATAGDLPSCHPATLHGDLHTANIIVDDQGPAFIDLDSLAAGDPAYDLAMLGSRLILSALSRGGHAEPALTLAASLPGWYADAGGRPIDDIVYAWYVAALLLGRQIKTCLRHSAPITGRIAPQLLEVARATLERGYIANA